MHLSYLSATLLFWAVVFQSPSIGSGLNDGMALVYASAGVSQPPWIYESVRVVTREGFVRCVQVARRDQAVREVCLRDDTLFESDGKAEPRATRPIGPNMRLEVVSGSGQVSLYETGSLASRTVAGGGEVAYLPTTITTRNAGGIAIRRLREAYAPALLTALSGQFEEPDGSGGWKSTREFTLMEIRKLVASCVF